MLPKQRSMLRGGINLFTDFIPIGFFLPYNIRMNNFTRTNRGFTLVEILVAISIMVVLMTIVLASVGEARKKGRDAERISEIAQLEAALRTYAVTYGRYPSTADGNCAHNNSFATGGCMNVLVTAGLFPSLPADPQHSATTYYHYDNWCQVYATTTAANQQYRLWADGERNNNGLLKNWWNNNTIGATTCVDPS